MSIFLLPHSMKESVLVKENASPGSERDGEKSCTENFLMDYLYKFSRESVYSLLLEEQ